MPRMRAHCVRQRHQHRMQRTMHGGSVAGWEVNATDRSSEQGVAHERLVGCIAHQRHAPRTVPGGMQHPPHGSGQFQLIAVRQRAISAACGDRHADERAEVELWIVQKCVFRRVQQHPSGRKRSAHLVQSGNVVRVRVGQQNVARHEPLSAHELDHFFRILTGINDPALAPDSAPVQSGHPCHVAVGLKGAQWKLLNH